MFRRKYGKSREGSLHVYRAGLVIFVAILLVDGLGYSQDQTKWHGLPAFDSFTSPAVSGHSDGKVYVVGVAFGGLVAYTTSDSPGGWTNWQIIGSEPTGSFNDPAFYADPHTPPVLLRDGSTLYLFARGNDDNLYETRKEGGNSWSSWHQLTTDQSILGRFSVCITKADPRGPLAIVQDNCHVISRGPGDTVEYRRFFMGTSPWSASGTVDQVKNAIEGTLGTDGKNQLLLAVRTTGEGLLILKKFYPWNASWKTILSFEAEGPLGGYKDVTNVVYLGGEFHLVYALKFLAGDITPFYAYHLEHLRLPPGRAESIHFVETYNPQTVTGEEHPRAELAV